MSKKIKNENEVLVRLEKEGFELQDNGYIRGNHRVEVSYQPGEKEPVQTLKFYEPGNEKPVFHTNAGVSPSKEFWSKYLGEKE